MTNKTTTICCTLALLASVAATPAFSQAKNFAGPSIAIGGGYNSTTVINKETIMDGPDEGETSTVKFGDNNFNALLDLSYGFLIDNNFVLSIGATYDLTTTEVDAASLTDADGYNYTAKAKLKDHYSLYFQPTYLVSNSTGIFAKVGYHNVKGTLTLFDGAALESASISKNIDGWGYGIGAKTFLNNNTYLQFEGNFIKYKDKNGEFMLDNTTYNQSIKPEVLSALVSIGYKF
jgi:opacity protein-like surface antigen